MPRFIQISNGLLNRPTQRNQVMARSLSEAAYLLINASNLLSLECRTTLKSEIRFCPKGKLFLMVGDENCIVMLTGRLSESNLSHRSLYRTGSLGKRLIARNT